MSTSVRPRPVTATVTKPRWMQPEAIVGQRRSASLESRGSTASLTSILDHSSCEDFTDDEEEERQREIQQQRSREREIRRKNLNLNKPEQKKKITAKKIPRKFVEVSQTDFTDEDITEPKMSPWEEWLITKTKELRIKKRQERERKKREKQEELEKEQEKQLLLKRAEEKRSEWLEKKHFEENLKKRTEKQKEKTEKMIKDEEKQLIDEKAIRKFNEWLENKKFEERQKKIQEKRTHRDEENREKQQKIKAQQKYEEWARKAKAKPKPMSNSFGYTSGKLTGYHDTGAYPIPAFYNPIPWCHPNIPKSAPERGRSRKPKPKYVWNPDKYR